MGKSKVASIRIDEDVLREAKELGLNISKISENALKEAIKRLKGENILNSHSSDDFSFKRIPMYITFLIMRKVSYLALFSTIHRVFLLLIFDF
jgi:hypothetical protein